jgi:NADH-quinone oxidoreductase subunit A
MALFKLILRSSMCNFISGSGKGKEVVPCMNDITPVVVMALLVGGLAAAFIAVSAFFGPKKRSRVKDEPFECGLPSEGMGHRTVPVHFYLVALLFILFDIELAFLFPWAVIFRSLGLFGFMEMLIFFVIVGAGFIYAWKTGALEWE